MKHTKYNYIIFDADHTLIDFDADEERAIIAAFESVGVHPTADMVHAVWAFSLEDWGGLGLFNVHLPEIQEGYHALYHTHVAHILEYMDTMYGLNGKREAAREVFVEVICRASHLIDGAAEVLASLGNKYNICIATNGLSAIQRGRLRELMPDLHRVYISEEVGTIKPAAAFFAHILHDLGAESGECLLVGDSLSSDIAGAAGCGMDSIWFNRHGGDCPEGVTEITDLRQLLKIL